MKTLTPESLKKAFACEICGREDCYNQYRDSKFCKNEHNKIMKCLEYFRELTNKERSVLCVAIKMACTPILYDTAFDQIKSHEAMKGTK